MSNDAWSAIVPGRLKVPTLGFTIWSLASSGLRSGAKSRLFDPAHYTNHARRHISLESHDCSQRSNCWGPALRSGERPNVQIHSYHSLVVGEAMLPPKKLRHTGEGRCPSRKWI